MNAGDLNRGQLQAWALNRYCYQAIIPIKDSVILSRMTDPALRRVWRQRIIDHDGDGDHDGGIARWFVLAEGLGLERTTWPSLARNACPPPALPSRPMLISSARSRCSRPSPRR